MDTSEGGGLQTHPKRFNLDSVRLARQSATKLAVLRKIANCGCGCVAIIADVGIAGVMMRVAITAILNFLKLYKMLNCRS